MKILYENLVRMQMCERAQVMEICCGFTAYSNPSVTSLNCPILQNGILLEEKERSQTAALSLGAQHTNMQKK